MKRRPGVLIYFTIRPCLARLSDQEKGVLFQAILDYGETGQEPDFDGLTGLAWDFIRPGLDRDQERYEERVAQCAQAARRRWDAPGPDRPYADASGRMRTHANYNYNYNDSFSDNGNDLDSLIETYKTKQAQLQKQRQPQSQ